LKPLYATSLQVAPEQKKWYETRGFAAGAGFVTGALIFKK
jgi:hypothetical protein